jgi:hypothetical protein
MRRATALLAAGLLLLATAAGCGGSEELAPQAPGPPAEMPLPESNPPAAADTEDEATEETDPDAAEPETGTDPATEDPLAEPGATEDTTTVPPVEEAGAIVPTEPEPAPAAAPEDDGGGAVAPEVAPDGPANDTPPPAGSNAERFEDFCAQNPGAC